MIRNISKRLRPVESVEQRSKVDSTAANGFQMSQEKGIDYDDESMTIQHPIDTVVQKQRLLRELFSKV
jgi:hypothetical protein